MYGIKKIKQMNADAMEVHEAKKLGIVSPSRGLGQPLNHHELAEFDKKRRENKYR